MYQRTEHALTMWRWLSVNVGRLRVQAKLRRAATWRETSWLGQTRSVSGARPDKPVPVPDFTDVRYIYGSKTWLQLLRTFLVFSLCSWPILTNNHLKILQWTRTVFGGRVFRRLMRATVYGQFMAGESPAEVLSVARRNTNTGIYAMFAYTAAELHGQASILKCSVSQEELHSNNYKAIRDGLQMAAAANAFSYFTPQLATKLTFFMSSELLVNLSCLIERQKVLLEQATTDADPRKRDEFKQYLTAVLNRAKVTYKDCGMPLPKAQASGDIHIPTLTTNLPFNLELSQNREVFAFVKNAPNDYKPLSHSHEEELIEKWQKLTKLGQYACDEGVSLLLDAEQTYLQPAIEAITVDMMRKYNNKRCVIHNTYQCYLKRTYDIVLRDLDLADRENFHLGLKVVRGAYIDEEKARAQDLGYDDPVNESYLATSRMYERVTRLLLERLTRSDRLHVTFATHNLDSVKFVINKMNELGITLENKHIAFAQLLGMRDYISFPLGHNGFNVAKLLHYGKVEDGVAYLARRLTENKSGLTAADIERALVWKEIRRRMTRKADRQV